MRSARRKKVTVNGDAVEFLAEKSSKDWQKAEEIIGDLADALGPEKFEAIARKHGWTRCCNGTGFVWSDDYGQVECREGVR